MAQTPHPMSPGGTVNFAGRPVARIGYGAMQLRNSSDDPQFAVRLVKKAIELGVNHIDTAEFYGNGFVNRVLREALQSKSGVVVATKIGADPNAGEGPPIRLAQRPEELRASVEQNLISLGLEQIPLVNLRRADTGPHVAKGDQLVDIDDQIATMVALRDEGKIGAIGLSAVGLDLVQRVQLAGIACIQNAYSLVDRQFDDLLKFCSDHSIAWVPFFPLGGAAAGMAKVTEQPEVLAIADRLGVTTSQVGLAWLLQKSENILLIPGTSSISHLEENCAAGSVVLDDGAMRELEAIRRARAEARH